MNCLVEMCIRERALPNWQEICLVGFGMQHSAGYGAAPCMPLGGSKISRGQPRGQILTRKSFNVAASCSVTPEQDNLESEDAVVSLNG
jgi:hypothetical protein